VVSGLTKELLTGYAATWPEAYPASSTRSRVRDRPSTFLRYCYQAEWLPRIPKLSPVKVEQAPTMPLTPKEYAHLLDASYATFADEPGRGARVRALIQLMRYSGLAIRDALTLKREEITHVADVEASGDTMNGELHVALDRTDFLAVFPLKDKGRVRLIVQSVKKPKTNMRTYRGTT
jgi:hypothetical protein